MVAKGAQGPASCAPGGIANYKTTRGCSRCVERGSPYSVLEQHREGFWKKNQDDEITICPAIWSFGLYKGHTPGVLGGRGRGHAGLPRVARGVGAFNPTISISLSPKSHPNRR